jgi:type II secretory ATPase GspE/PulE/Tfp pilus assembly ATPase PilB-like protein
MDLERGIYERLISRLKLLSGMILNIRNEAQDGRFTFTTKEKEVEVRSSIIPGASGESMVMRLLDPTVASFNLEQLGLNAILYGVMVEEISRPNGLIITTGPTGSGKTTALYAFLRKAHTADVKIITIENPVEYKVDGIVQTQVGNDYTFESGLRAILRQDPDIIMVGEIRDREVAETAIHAAQTGHLVFSTLHTNSAVGSFPRMIDLGVDYRMIGSSVNIVLGQRLVRVLCEHCKKARAANDTEAGLIRKILATHPKPPPVTGEITIYEEVGCEKCNHTGFKGRQGVYEAIRVDQDVEAAIINDPREHIILAAAKKQGIPTMAEDGIEKVLLGKTSLAELKRVVDLTEGRHIVQSDATTVPGADADFLAHIVS